MKKTELKGKAVSTKGRVKGASAVTGDKKLEREGAVQDANDKGKQGGAGMVTRTRETASVARTYALIFGIAYIAVALVEAVLGSKGLHIGGQLILKITPLQNAVHWIVGLGVLASYFAGNVAARVTARVVGWVFVGLTLLGLVARDFTGRLLGFHAPLPWSYNIVHAATALFALFAGYAAARAYGSDGTAPSRRA